MKEKELEVIKFLHPNLFDNDYPGLDLEAFDDLNLAHKKACLSSKYVVFSVIDCYPSAFKKSTIKLKDDGDVAIVAICEDPKNFKHISRRLKTSDIFIENLLKNNGLVLKFLSKEIRGSKKHVEIAIKSRGKALEFANDELKHNKSLVIKAVENNGMALEFAGDRLRNNKHIVVKAVANNGMALEFASHRLRNNKRIAVKAVRNSGEALRHVSHRLKKDMVVIWEALRSNRWAYHYIDDEIKNSPSFVLTTDTDFFSTGSNTCRTVTYEDEKPWEKISKQYITSIEKYFD